MYGLDTPYPKTALNGVSISVNKGTFACIMGTSGSGKTTLINILSTIDEATSGKLLIFDQNIVGLSDKEKANIRKRYMGFIFQDYNLFNYSIKKNIVFNDDSKSINFNEFADNWGLFEILNKFSKGYNTIIGKEFDRNGIELSGGESQKIAIARAGYKKASLYILDEPTSALDVHAETFFVEKTACFTESNIVIIVSHNLLTTKNCDKIFVIDDGEVIEEGTHKNLLEKNKVYADMYKSNIQKWR